MRRLHEFRETCTAIDLQGDRATFCMDNPFSVGLPWIDGEASRLAVLPKHCGKIISRYAISHGGTPFDEWLSAHISDVISIVCAEDPSRPPSKVSEVYDGFIAESRATPEWTHPIKPPVADPRVTSIEIATTDGCTHITGYPTDFTQIESALAKLRDGRVAACSEDGTIVLSVRVWRDVLRAPSESIRLAMRTPACSLSGPMLNYYVGRSLGEHVVVNKFRICVNEETGHEYNIDANIANRLCQTYGIIAWSDDRASYAEYHRMLGTGITDHPDSPLYSHHMLAGSGEVILAAMRKYCEIFYRRHSFVDFTSPLWNGATDE